MSVSEVVHDYYDALRDGEPLGPYFHDDAVVKIGVGEELYGGDEIVEGLADQTRTTHEWMVDSRRLTVDDRDAYAVVADEVELAWTDRTTGSRYRFETRWTAILEPVDGDHRFVTMHVSAPRSR